MMEENIDYDFFYANIMDVVNQLVKQIEQQYIKEEPITKNNIDNTEDVMINLLVEMVEAVKTELEVGSKPAVGIEYQREAGVACGAIVPPTINIEGTRLGMTRRLVTMAWRGLKKTRRLLFCCCRGE